MKKINSKNFDHLFCELLENKGGENVIKGRFDIESVPLVKKLDFIIQFFYLKLATCLTYKILFWENDDLIVGLMTSINATGYFISKSYKNEQDPGVLYLDVTNFDELTFRELLTYHFNYEMARIPSLNMRVQICFYDDNNIKLLDIYDDRGFDFYILENQ